MPAILELPVMAPSEIRAEGALQVRQLPTFAENIFILFGFSEKDVRLVKISFVKD